MKGKYNTWLTILIIMVSLTSHAQYHQFSYNARGHRVTRQFVVPKSATIPADSLMAKELKKPVDDQIGLQKARIYPNPTKGMLRIDLPALTQQEAIISLHDANGRLIIQQPAVEVNNELNLSDYPAGIYIMSIQIGRNDRKEWKIIKE